MFHVRTFALNYSMFFKEGLESWNSWGFSIFWKPQEFLHATERQSPFLPSHRKVYRYLESLPLHTHQIFREHLSVYVCVYSHCFQYLHIQKNAISTLQKVVLYYMYYVCMHIPRCVHILFVLNLEGILHQGARVFQRLCLWDVVGYYSGVTLEEDTSCFENSVGTWVSWCNLEKLNSSTDPAAEYTS